MKWHEKAITSGCRKAAESLAERPWIKKFYLAGGTALALQLGHRISVDLNFFTSALELNFVERQTLSAELAKLGAQIEEESEGTLHALLHKTHLSFFRYQVPLLRPLKTWAGMAVADPFDISQMKIGAVIGRGSRKDFHDLYAIIKSGINLSQILRGLVKKFPHARNISLQALKALVYFADADREPSIRMTAPVAWEAVKKIIEKEVKGIRF